MSPSQSSPFPSLEVIPMHAAMAANRATSLDVLVRIVPPPVEIKADRIPLNLSLVIDRSGSMQGSKMASAREAACFAVEHLLPCDRLSVVLFDDRIETLIPSTLATDKQGILQKIRQVHSRGSTALHSGWVEGGMQVSHYLNDQQLNRVLLLSDGLANVGETRPDAIAADVNGLAQRGVSTTTLGIGEDYSEDLLAAMARSGDGNFYHIESPNQLPEIFETELSGLSATLGQRVSLGLKPASGVKVADVLNDFDLTATGRYKLPNLMVGAPINMVVRLQIPALAATGQSPELLNLRLAWDDPQQSARQVLRAQLALPLVSPEQLSDFPANATVQEQVALLMAARARQEAIHFSDLGDYERSRQSLSDARIAMSAIPLSPQLLEETSIIEDLEQEFTSGSLSNARKKAAAQSYNLSRGGKSQPRRQFKQPEE